MADKHKDQPQGNVTRLPSDPEEGRRRSGKWLEQDKTPFGQEDRSDSYQPGEGLSGELNRQGGPDFPETPVDQHYSENIDSRGQGGRPSASTPEVVDEA